MSEWWQKPYPQGPAQPVPGFPRPMYPPDVKGGYHPSANGIDAKAYKRMLGRGGRWPWDPPSYDAAYSNGFAHGRAGGQVGDSGVAGFQRQMGIEDTGNLGNKTFSSLLRSLIPKGLPNAGQPLADTTALNMLGEAWQQFKGQPTPPPPAGATLRQKALKAAQGQLGVKESPLGSNHTKYGEWYGVDYQPWCAIFVTWSYETQGDSPSFVKGSRYAYVPYIVSDAQNVRYGLSLTSSPIPGDLVCYDWDGQDYDHVELFESGNTTSWTAIGGNTSAEGDSSGSQSNGGGVYRRNRSRSQTVKVAFVRVAA